MLEYDPHIVVITETWLREEVDDADVFPPNYQVFRCDRCSRGGGVAVLVKHGCDATGMQAIARHEAISLKASCFGYSFLIFAAYRPPDSPIIFLNDLADHMSTFRSEKNILAGDFNLPGIDWERPSPVSGRGSHADKLCDIMLCHDLQQVVCKPTRVQGDSYSVLDLVFLSRSNENLSVSVERGLSDHSMVYVSFPVRDMNKEPTTKTVSFKDFSHANDESIRLLAALP